MPLLAELAKTVIQIQFVIRLLLCQQSQAPRKTRFGWKREALATSAYWAVWAFCCKYLPGNEGLLSSNPINCLISRAKSRPGLRQRKDMAPALRESPRKTRESRESRERSHQHDKKRTATRARYESSSSGTSSQVLSVNALAKLDQLNQKEASRSAEVTPTKPRRKRQHREVVEEKIVVEKRRQHKRKKRRVVSGALLEEGDSSRLKGIRGGARYEKDEYDSEEGGGKKKRLCWLPL